MEDDLLHLVSPDRVARHLALPSDLLHSRECLDIWMEDDLVSPDLPCLSKSSKTLGPTLVTY